MYVFLLYTVSNITSASWMITFSYDKRQLPVRKSMTRFHVPPPRSVQVIGRHDSPEPQAAEPERLAYECDAFIVTCNETAHSYL